jgi:ribosomal protein RSM22 (predicted rRNA methylase)
MTPILPPALRAAVQKLAMGTGGLDIRVRRMSEHFRKGGSSNPTLDFNAYLVARLPATYASVAACINELLLRKPDFAPRTLLDAGSGPGTASWAAVEAFPRLSGLAFIDNNQEFLSLASALAQHSDHPALRQAKTQIADLGQPLHAAAADLVIAAYALAELPLGKIAAATGNLWAAARDVLIIVEPGTPQGYARVIDARSLLIAEGAHIIAPCLHGNACPLSPPDWCHFNARLPRSREHMHAKKAAVPYEDEKYCYLIAARSPVQNTGSRILAPPVATKGETRFKLCSENGLSHRKVAARDKAEHKRARKLGWGDLF